ASLLWFSTLAIGAAWLAPWLARPATWRMLDLMVAVMMFAVAALDLTGNTNTPANATGQYAPTALEPLFPIFVAWLCAGPGAM
uniref:LysE family transporter n=1 Tax=Pseudomonas sp. 32_A TaxID=2813559 RepID=UPI001FAEBB4C